MKKITRLLLWIPLILYSYVVLDLLLWGRGIITDASAWEHITTTSNLIPFKTIVHQMGQYFSGENRGFALRNLGGNFFLLFPIGFWLPYLVPKINRLWKIALGMTAFIVIAELLQGLLCIGFFDIDDLLFNVLGGVCGFCLLRLFQWFCRLLTSKRSTGRSNR